MYKLTLHETPKATNVQHISKGDVIATKFGKKGEPQALRSILNIEDVQVNGKAARRMTLGFPKRGEKTGVSSLLLTKSVCWVGHVDPITGEKPASKKQAPAKAEAPKVDSMAKARAAKAAKAAARKEQELKAPAAERQAEPTLLQKRAAEPKAQTPTAKLSLADRLAAKLEAKLGDALDQAIDTALDRLIDKALA